MGTSPSQRIVRLGKLDAERFGRFRGGGIGFRQNQLAGCRVALRWSKSFCLANRDEKIMFLLRGHFFMHKVVSFAVIHV